MIDPDLINRATEYAKLSGIRLDLNSPLGHGTDGAVWKSSRQTAPATIAVRTSFFANVLMRFSKLPRHKKASKDDSENQRFNHCSQQAEWRIYVAIMIL